ncbi:DNA repair protein [Plasmodium vivax Brazil I]|uniref:DNA repair protein n=1 Tax=Plasmodium vivax (strain Brazil I) TaxID=1033975 RepID=A0A0J9T381_PLAV1|nr:DNA repair protein [Plasmodium vivax Brazil I]
MAHSDDSQNEREEEEEANYNTILYEQNLKDEIDYYGEDLPHINFYLKFQRKNFLQEFLQEVVLPSGGRSVEESKQTAGVTPVGQNKQTAGVPPVEENREASTTGEGSALDNAIARDAHLEEVLNEGGFYVEGDSEGEEPPCEGPLWGQPNEQPLLEEPHLLPLPPEEETPTVEHQCDEANVRDANVRDANVRDANVRDANVRDAQLRDAQLRDAQLRDAQLRDALLKLTQGNPDLTHLYEGDEAVKQLNEIFQKNKDKFMFSVERQVGTNGELILQEYCFLCNKKKKLNKPLCAVNIYVCYDCKVTDSNFKMISLTKLVRKYCLNHYDLCKYQKDLALLCMKNPRGYSKQMKLYFLFQIKEIAIRKHGSLERVKQLYTSKLLNSFRNAQATPQMKKKRKELHKMVKPKSIYSKKVKQEEDKKIICDDNQHQFDSPTCTNAQDSLYVKRCKRCAYQVEYMQF